MILNLIKRLTQRTKNIIGTILDILIIVTVASLVMCLVFGVIGKLAKLPFMTSLAGFCFLIFLITAGALMTISIILLICFIIDIINRGGLKELLKRQIKTFMLSFIVIIVIRFIKYKNLEWVESFSYSLLATLSMLFKTEASMFSKEIEQEYLLNPTFDESDSK